MKSNHYNSQPPSRPDQAGYGLTAAELKVLRLVCLGCPTHLVAAILGRSIHTVANHKNNAMRKLGVHNAASATRRALQIGLLSLDDELTPEELKKLAAAGLAPPNSVLASPRAPHFGAAKAHEKTAEIPPEQA